MSQERSTRTRQRARAEQRKAERAQAQERFLKELARRGNVSAAARKAKVGRRTAYEWYEADAEFAAAWDEALEVAIDALEGEAWRRAQTGVLKPVYQRGELVGKVREYSDTLMVTLLKAHRPEKYRERFEHTGRDGGPVQVQVVYEDPDRPPT